MRNYINGIYTCENEYENFEGFTLKRGFKVIRKEHALREFPDLKDYILSEDVCTSGWNTQGMVFLYYHPANEPDGSGWVGDWFEPVHPERWIPDEEEFWDGE